MRHLYLVLGFALIVLLIIAGCSTTSLKGSSVQMTTQPAQTNHKDLHWTDVDTTVSVAPEADFELERLPNTMYEIEVISDVPITIKSYGEIPDANVFVVEDMNPRAYQILNYKGSLYPLVRGGIKIMNIDKTRLNPVVHVKISRKITTTLATLSDR